LNGLAARRTDCRIYDENRFSGLLHDNLLLKNLFTRILPAGRDTPT